MLSEQERWRTVSTYVAKKIHHIKLRFARCCRSRRLLKKYNTTVKGQIVHQMLRPEDIIRSVEIHVPVPLGKGATC